MEYLLDNDRTLSIVVNKLDNSLDYQIDSNEIKSISIPDLVIKTSLFFTEIDNLSINSIKDPSGRKSFFVIQNGNTLKSINEISKDVNIFLTGIFIYALFNMLFYLFLLFYSKIKNQLSVDELLLYIPGTIVTIFLSFACFKTKKISVTQIITIFSIFCISLIYLLFYYYQVIHQIRYKEVLGIILINFACAYYSFCLIKQAKVYNKFLKIRKT